MITSAKLKILATVPVAMIFEFMLLNVFFGSNTSVNVSQETLSTSYNHNDDFSFAPSKQQAMPKFFKRKTKIKVLSFPKPAAHTFVGREENQENFRLDGVIIK